MKIQDSERERVAVLEWMSVLVWLVWMRGSSRVARIATVDSEVVRRQE